MLQKVIQVGNSAAVTIPKDFLKKVRLKIGDQIMVETDQAMQTLSIRPKTAPKRLPITPEFARWVEQFIEEYRPILDKLANK